MIKIADVNALASQYRSIKWYLYNNENIEANAQKIPFLPSQSRAESLWQAIVGGKADQEWQSMNS